MRYSLWMPITIYQYPGCSTCRRALKWLNEAGVSYQSVHIVEKPPSAATLKKAMKLGELPLRSLFNTSGESYRAGGFKDRLPTLKEAEAFAALSADGKLIKRPLVIADEFALVGFDEAKWASKLSS